MPLPLLLQLLHVLLEVAVVHEVLIEHNLRLELLDTSTFLGRWAATLIVEWHIFPAVV